MSRARSIRNSEQFIQKKKTVYFCLQNKNTSSAVLDRKLVGVVLTLNTFKHFTACQDAFDINNKKRDMVLPMFYKQIKYRTDCIQFPEKIVCLKNVSGNVHQ